MTHGISNIHRLFLFLLCCKFLCHKDGLKLQASLFIMLEGASFHATTFLQVVFFYFQISMHYVDWNYIVVRITLPRFIVCRKSLCDNCNVCQIIVQSIIISAKGLTWKRSSILRSCTPVKKKLIVRLIGRLVLPTLS